MTKGTTGDDEILTSGSESVLPPHIFLHRYYRTENERTRHLQRLFNASASHYDWLNQVCSLGTGVRYRRMALLRAGLRNGTSVLDVACGTGVIASLASDIVGPSGVAIGVDPSAAMREIARWKRGVSAIHGFAESLPVEDASIDFLAMGYGLRHVPDLRKAFREFGRVLRPGGTLLLLEITAPDHYLGRALLRFYLRAVVPTIARIGSRSQPPQELMQYHWESIQHCVRPVNIEKALRDADFLVRPRRLSLGIFSEYSATRPS